MTQVKGGGRIAVIKDTYGNAFVPFLLLHYSEIYVIDQRQFEQSLSALIVKHDIRGSMFLNNAEITSHPGFTRLIRKMLEAEYKKMPTWDTSIPPQINKTRRWRVDFCLYAASRFERLCR